MIRCRMDGLQVLKGGISKATVYFETKEATKGALDLNEQEVTISAVEFLPALDMSAPETVEDVERALTAALAEVSLYSRKLVEMAKQPVEAPNLFTEKGQA